MPYLGRHPELQEPARPSVAPCHDSTERALKNEEAPLEAKRPPIDL